MGIQERKEREKEQRKEEIINAAEKVFAEKGLALATMDDIAERAELSKGTLYLYYKSKEDLYIAVGLRGGEILRQKFLAATSGQNNVLKKIDLLGQAYFEFTQEYRQYFRMYQYSDATQLHRQVSEEMQQACKQNDQRIWSIVTGLIQQGIEEGLIVPETDVMQAGLIFWACNSSLIRLMDQGDMHFGERFNVDLKSTLRKANQLVLTGMLTEKGKEIYHILQSEEELAKP